jgi:anaerobic magnesium-protoporphyrin IX monomethyl ester cyclase
VQRPLVLVKNRALSQGALNAEDASGKKRSGESKGWTFSTRYVRLAAKPPSDEVVNITMKIAIIFPPAWAIDYPPVGTASIVQILRKEGHEVTAHDWNIDIWHYLAEKYKADWNQEKSIFWNVTYSGPAWESDFWDEEKFEEKVLPETRLIFKRKIDEILSGGYDAVGFSVFNSNAGAARSIVRRMRSAQPNLKLFIGGPAVNDIIFAKTLDRWFPDIDAAVVGEGEVACIDLFKAWKENAEFSGKRGIAALDKTGKLLVPPPGSAYPMSQLPSLDFEDFDLSKYSTSCLPIPTGRGCVNACSFCSESRTWKPYRSYPADLLVNDIDRCVKKYGTDNFIFIASVFNGDHELVRTICETIIARNLKITWSANARLADELDAGLIELMAKAGCYCLVFGMESASDDILKLMRKKSTSEIAARIANDCFRFGIRLSTNIVVGFPGETEADFDFTYNFIKENSRGLNTINVTKCQLAPGSSIYSQPKKYGIISDEIGALAVVEEEGGQIKSFRHEWKYISDWATEDLLNTPSVRQSRHDRLVSLVDSLQIRGNTPFDAKNSITGHNPDTSLPDAPLQADEVPESAEVLLARKVVRDRKATRMRNAVKATRKAWHPEHLLLEAIRLHKELERK